MSVNPYQTLRRTSLVGCRPVVVVMTCWPERTAEITGSVCWPVGLSVPLFGEIRALLPRKFSTIWFRYNGNTLSSFSANIRRWQILCLCPVKFLLFLQSSDLVNFIINAKNSILLVNLKFSFLNCPSSRNFELNVFWNRIWCILRAMMWIRYTTVTWCKTG